jgi:hypothetical protein
MTNNIMNIAIPPLWKKSGVKSMDECAGRLAFRKAVSNRLAFAMRAFNPDLILLSAGFDGAKHDVGNKRHGIRHGVSGLDLRSDDYYFLTAKIVAVAEICCQGRVVSALEGGYGRAAAPTPDASGSAVSDIPVCCPLELNEFANNVAGHLRGLAHLEREITISSPSAKRTPQAHAAGRRTRNEVSAEDEQSFGRSTRASASTDALPETAAAASQALAAAEKKKGQ